MTELQKYLQKATRGLYGKRKLEVREELESDITERTKRFELLGLEKPKAILKALEELGNPQKLAFGFWEVEIAMQKHFVFVSLALVTLSSVAIWQGTMQRNFSFSCTNPDHSTRFETQTKTSWLESMLVTRDLENLSWENISTDETKAEYGANSLRMEGRNGQFETKTHKPIILERLKLDVQNLASWDAYILRCTLQ